MKTDDRTPTPDLTEEQAALLAATLVTEAPFAAGDLSQEAYDAAYRAAHDAGLCETLDVLAAHFVACHASADEISAVGRGTLREVRAVVTLAYAEHRAWQARRAVITP